MPLRIYFAANKTQPTGPVDSPIQMATVNRAASHITSAKLQLEKPTHRRHIPAIQFELLAAQENNNANSNSSPSSESDQRPYTDVGSDKHGTSSFETDRESTSLKPSVWAKVRTSFKGFRNILNSKNVEETSQLSDIQTPIEQIPVRENPRPIGIRRASTSSAESAPTRPYRSAATVPQQPNAHAYLRRRNSAPGVLEQGRPQINFLETTHPSGQSTSAAIDPPMQPYVALQHPSFDFEEESGDNSKKWGESTLEAIDQVREQYRNQND